MRGVGIQFCRSGSNAHKKYCARRQGSIGVLKSTSAYKTGIHLTIRRGRPNRHFFESRPEAFVVARLTITVRQGQQRTNERR